MTHLSRNDLREFVGVLLLANTPVSLCKGLIDCSGMIKLRKCSSQELIEYYDRITARARRTELVIATAYAVLCAIGVRTRQGNPARVDGSRLLWGAQISEYLERSTIPTGYFSAQARPPSVQAVASSTTVSTAGFILDPYGRPAGNHDD